jgi:hypothetical protein
MKNPNIFFLSFFALSAPLRENNNFFLFNVQVGFGESARKRRLKSGLPQLEI